MAGFLSHYSVHVGWRLALITLPLGDWDKGDWCNYYGGALQTTWCQLFHWNSGSEKQLINSQTKALWFSCQRSYPWKQWGCRWSASSAVWLMVTRKWVKMLSNKCLIIIIVLSRILVNLVRMDSLLWIIFLFEICLPLQFLFRTQRHPGSNHPPGPHTDALHISFRVGR